MASPQMHLGLRKVLLLNLAFFVLILMLFCASIDSHELQTSRFSGSRRRLLELEEEDEQLLLIKKKSSSNLSSKKNKTELIKSSSSSSNLSTKNETKLVTNSNSSTTKNQTKFITKSNFSTTKNQTKLSKPTNSTKSTSSYTHSKSQLKQLNSTKPTTKSTNSTKTASKKTSDLLKLSPPKNKTATKTISKKTEEAKKQSTVTDPGSPKPQKSSTKEKNPTTQKPKQQRKQPSWIDDDEDDTDLVAEFRDLPTKFPQTFIPDLEKISTTSKAYITKYNKQITKQFKPYVGNKHAPTIATIISCAFLLIPLLLVSLICNRIKTYFSLQKVLIFIQVYLSIYFSILCLTSLVTGLEPLKYFYSTSPSTYVCLQVLQTLGYVLYLLLVLMYLILVFSTESGLGSKMLGLVQTLVGLAIGLHYYVAVFHRVVLRQPPKTNWKVHCVYASCFLLISLCARADWRKKAYLEEGGEEGKKN